MQASNLRIRIIREGQIRVDLTMGASATSNLVDLVPPDVSEKLAGRNIDLAKISRDSEAGGFAPGPLMELEEENRTVRVWLE